MFSSELNSDNGTEPFVRESDSHMAGFFMSFFFNLVDVSPDFLEWMEHLPRQRGCGCLSLKIGCVVTALVVILYTLLGLAQLSADLPAMVRELDHSSQTHVVLSVGAVLAMLIVHCVSFVLTALMLLGALREKVELIKLWVEWTSVQLLVAVLAFVLHTMTTVGHYDDDSMLLYVVAFFSLLVRFYMLVLVCSYCRQLMEDHEKLRSLVNDDTWYTEA